jgi:hypothetical protein
MEESRAPSMKLGCPTQFHLNQELCRKLDALASGADIIYTHTYIYIQKEKCGKN